MIFLAVLVTRMNPDVYIVQILKGKYVEVLLSIVEFNILINPWSNP